MSLGRSLGQSIGKSLGSSLGGGANGAPSGPQAEIAAMLAAGGDAWTFDGLSGLIGVANGVTLENTADTDFATGIVSQCLEQGAVNSGEYGAIIPPSVAADALLADVFNGGAWWVHMWCKVSLSADGGTAEAVSLDTNDTTPFTADFARTGSATSLVVVCFDADASESVTQEVDVTSETGFFAVDIWMTPIDRNVYVSINGGSAVSGAIPGVGSLNFTGLSGPQLSVCKIPTGISSDTASVDESLITAGEPTQAQISWLYNGGTGRSMSLFA